MESINRDIYKKYFEQENISVGQPIVKVNPVYFRPTEVDLLIGDATKARNTLNWKPKYSLNEIVNEMVESDITVMRNEAIINYK